MICLYKLHFIAIAKSCSQGITFRWLHSANLWSFQDNTVHSGRVNNGKKNFNLEPKIVKYKVQHSATVCPLIILLKLVVGFLKHVVRDPLCNFVLCLSHHPPSGDGLECKQLMTKAQLILKCFRRRKNLTEKLYLQRNN